ncbi:hypothetical protein E1B28_009740 [Marasmius oreades]|uniref:Uncharacterized protein n=1 Tax=Marasmius oreades TaxID=181124 RepID=A0A9P7RWB4_9AGAR|nr:uncharacterized protein E1B28_009740 [Marasmius oreades]KAG7090638.1 hypothetical protein E1B28_009740 [Marasmius oreades]
MEMLFPVAWLDKISSSDSRRRTNRQVQTEDELRRELTTHKQKFIGTILQSCAALTHYMSREVLKSLAPQFLELSLYVETMI